MAEVDKLHFALQWAVENDFQDKDLMEYLAPCDRRRLSVLVKRLEAVADAAKPRGAPKRAFEGKRSNILGKVYERIVEELFRNSRAVASYRNVQTTTNELDVLLIFNSHAAFADPFRHWGPHSVCECKLVNGRVQPAWVDKLATVLSTQGAQAGMLFSRRPLGKGSRIRFKLQLLAVQSPPKTILCLSWDDIMACVNGQNILGILSERYVVAKAGIDDAALAR